MEKTTQDLALQSILGSLVLMLQGTVCVRRHTLTGCVTSVHELHTRHTQHAHPHKPTLYHTQSIHIQTQHRYKELFHS